MQSSKSTTKVVMVAAFAAISYLLMFFSFPILPAVSFLKLDFADIAVLSAFCVLGFTGGIATIVVRSLLYLVVTGFEFSHVIGVFANACASLLLGGIFYLVLTMQKNPSKKAYFFAALGATLALTLGLALLNYFVLMPAYMSVLQMKLPYSLVTYVLEMVVPFNLIKGIVLMAVFSLVYQRLVTWAKSHQFQPLS